MTKRFGEVVANSSVTIDAWPGEVHCLLGENGAGKSTLIAMLGGLQRPDEGSIEIDGVPCALNSPAESLANGIGVVYQHSTLIPSMTVIDNLLLAQHRRFWLQRAAAHTHLAELNDLFGSEIGPEQLVSELGLGQQQQIEIATVMRGKPRVLVLDEPTSMLSARDTDALITSIRRLSVRGVTVIFVTHKLDEALALGGQITVLREGRVVRSFAANELRSSGEDHGRAQILAAMFGDATLAHRSPGHERRHSLSLPLSLPEPASSDVLLIDGVSTTDTRSGTPLAGVTFRVRAGEIVGVAGIDGHGQRHLAEVIAGQRAPVEGRVVLDGRDITRATIRERQRLGVRYVTDDRLHEGIVGSFSVAINLLLKRIGERPYWRFGRMNRAAVVGHADHLIAQYGIRASSPNAAAGTLSGGNIQKILLARELSDKPRVVVFHQPSHGLDLKTVRFVRDEIVRLAESGSAVLLISTDLEELTALSDRVAVISRGRITGEMANEGDRMRERVGALIVGSTST